jgi:hypothetical protein
MAMIERMRSISMSHPPLTAISIKEKVFSCATGVAGASAVVSIAA